MSNRIFGIIVLLILASTAAIHAQTCSGMSLGNAANLNGFVPFPSTDAWNTNIATAPVDPNSAAITSAGGFAGLHLHVNFGSQTDDGGIPYVVVDSTQTPSAWINVIDYAGQSDVVVAPFPANAPMKARPPTARAGRIPIRAMLIRWCWTAQSAISMRLSTPIAATGFITPPAKRFGI
jgi:hypothetical protein